MALRFRMLSAERPQSVGDPRCADRGERRARRSKRLFDLPDEVARLGKKFEGLENAIRAANTSSVAEVIWDALKHAAERYMTPAFGAAR